MEERETLRLTFELPAQALDQENEARLAQAEDDARRVQAEAESRLATERENMLRGARNEVASLALLAAAKAAQTALNADSDRALVDAFLAEVGEPHE